MATLDTSENRLPTKMPEVHANISSDERPPATKRPREQVRMYTYEIKAMGTTEKIQVRAFSREPDRADTKLHRGYMYVCRILSFPLSLSKHINRMVLVLAK